MLKIHRFPDTEAPPLIFNSLAFEHVNKAKGTYERRCESLSCTESQLVRATQHEHVTKSVMLLSEGTIFLNKSPNLN